MANKGTIQQGEFKFEIVDGKVIPLTTKNLPKNATATTRAIAEEVVSSKEVGHSL